MGKDQPQRPENQQNVILFCSSSTRVHEMCQSFLAVLFPPLLEPGNCKKCWKGRDGYGQGSTTKARKPAKRDLILQLLY